MIKISVDEAYVFDMLSILEVKMKKLEGDKLSVAYNSSKKLISEIVDQIGIEKYKNIIISDEYKQLVQANQNIFDLVDESQKNEGMAKVTDDANFARHLRKMNLQKAHFNNDLTEVKNRE